MNALAPQHGRLFKEVRISVLSEKLDAQVTTVSSISDDPHRIDT